MWCMPKKYRYCEFGIIIIELILDTSLFNYSTDIHQLRGEVKRLQDYRSNGIKRLAMSEVYECLKSRRTNNIGQRSALETLLATIQVR